jgi:hypothetical protein
MQTGTSSSTTASTNSDRTGRWMQRVWTFGVTAALLGALGAVMLTRVGANGLSPVPQPVARAATGALAQPAGDAAPRTEYGVIIVADDAQAARVRTAVAEGAAFVAPRGAPSIVFDVVVVADDAAADRLRAALQANSSLLAATGHEPTLFDARGVGPA